MLKVVCIALVAAIVTMTGAILLTVAPASAATLVSTAAVTQSSL